MILKTTSAISKMRELPIPANTKEKTDVETHDSSRLR